MRIAIVSDVHGNRTAFEAVLADLRQTSPDLILHGGDLADAGASPAERWEKRGSHGCADCRALRFTVRWRSCTPVPRVPGAHPCRKQAIPSWSRFTDRSASRLRSMGISIGLTFAAFQE